LIDSARSIKHFCELYETYFKDGTKELVAIRESIRLDSSLGRALVGILLVFAQMEREATGERTKEAINHIRKSGYHFGKVPYGKRTIPAPDHPRMKILVEDEAEQRTIAQIKEWASEGVGISEMAAD
jgi:DNA invertase Pin-like site-specific DNA recombinase